MSSPTFAKVMLEEVSSSIQSKLPHVRQKILKTGDMVCLRFVDRAAAACASATTTSHQAVVECKEYLWEQLHSYHWKDVPEAYRDAFGFITLVYIFLTKKTGAALSWGGDSRNPCSGSGSGEGGDGDIWRLADIGLLLGADLCRPLLQRIASIAPSDLDVPAIGLQASSSISSSSSSGAVGAAPVPALAQKTTAKKRKATVREKEVEKDKAIVNEDDNKNIDNVHRESTEGSTGTTTANLQTKTKTYVLDPVSRLPFDVDHSLRLGPIRSERCPSVSHFYETCLLPGEGVPCVLQGCMEQGATERGGGEQEQQEEGDDDRDEQNSDTHTTSAASGNGNSNGNSNCNSNGNGNGVLSVEVGTGDSYRREWPALRKWKSLAYLLSHLGHRVVPVETGGSYLHDTSGRAGTALMTGQRFADAFLHRKTNTDTDTNTSTNQDSQDSQDSRDSRDKGKEKKAKTGPSTVSTAGGVEMDMRADVSMDTSASLDLVEQSLAQQSYGTQMAYLAQHQLFEQVPALRADIGVPDYCAMLSPQEEESALGGDNYLALHAWMGPCGTVSPLHYDSYSNILAQVTGFKYVRIYAPSESDKLLPMEGKMRNNSAVDLVENYWDEHININVVEPNNNNNNNNNDNDNDNDNAPVGGESEAEVASTWQENQNYHPATTTAEYRDVVLGPGDMLFIPRHHWHLVCSIDESTANRLRKEGSLPREGESKEKQGFLAFDDPNPEFSFSVSYWWGKRLEKCDASEGGEAPKYDKLWFM